MKKTLYVIGLLIYLANTIGAAYDHNIHSVCGWLSACFLQITLLLEFKNED